MLLFVAGICLRLAGTEMSLVSLCWLFGDLQLRLAVW